MTCRKDETLWQVNLWALVLKWPSRPVCLLFDIPITNILYNLNISQYIVQLFFQAKYSIISPFRNNPMGSDSIYNRCGLFHMSLGRLLYSFNISSLDWRLNIQTFPHFLVDFWPLSYLFSALKIHVLCRLGYVLYLLTYELFPVFSLYYFSNKMIISSLN